MGGRAVECLGFERTVDGGWNGRVRDDNVEGRRGERGSNSIEREGRAGAEEMEERGAESDGSGGKDEER
jgi:hypothetical protein